MPCCKSSQWPRCSHVAHHVPMFSKHQHWTQRWQLFQLCSWISYIEWSDGPNALEWTKRPAHPPPKNSHMDNNTRLLCCLQTGRMLLRKLLLCSSSHFQTREIWTGITSRIGSDIWGSNGGEGNVLPIWCTISILWIGPTWDKKRACCLYVLLLNFWEASGWLWEETRHWTRWMLGLF